MAPEQLSGGQYSYSANIWSFGLIMLELLLGQYPHPQHGQSAHLGRATARHHGLLGVRLPLPRRAPGAGGATKP